METIAQPIDVAVIGAGLSGLVSAQVLSQAGYRVVIVDKSRGLGGRLATRRLQDTCADHGVRSLTVQGLLSQQLIQTLEQQQVLQPWSKPLYRGQNGTWFATDTIAYSNPTGLNAIAKWLATGLEIRRDQQVEAIMPQSAQWQLQCTATQTVAQIAELQARALVVAIPAPQALRLLEPLQSQGFPAEAVAALHQVEFDPCLTVIATYNADRQTVWNQFPWQALQIEDDSHLAWLSLETSKYPSRYGSVAVIQSTGRLAQQWLETTDLQAVGRLLVQQAANWVPELSQPTEQQVHRWRYALVRQPWTQPHLSVSVPLPISCSGDWCGGQTIESALRSGLEAGTQIDRMLDHRMPTHQTGKTDFANLLKPLIQHP
jgi:renalase